MRELLDRYFVGNGYRVTTVANGRQMREALANHRVDLIVLETFSDLNEIQQALLAIRSMCDLPIVAQMTIQTDGLTSYGTSPEVLTRQLDEWGADVIGLNCSVGPHTMLEAIEVMRSLTHRKLSSQPNGGLPRQVDGRMFYRASPEYMAKYAKRLIQAGAKFVGGCCGTTPETIKQIARRCELTVATTYHLVRTLAYEGYVIRREDGTYIVGLEVADRYRELVTALARTPEDRTADDLVVTMGQPVA